MDSQTPNTRDGMDVAEGVEPAAAEPAAAPSLEFVTLAQRMASIRAESYGIGKSDITMQGKEGGKSFTIKGHTVEAVLAEIRPLLAKYQVGVTPSLIERSYAGNRCDIIVDFEFEALDDCTDRKVVRWAGAGTDNGDKAFSKAGTNALKEMLKKLFLITDRDDAKEEEDKVEHAPEGVSGAVNKAKEATARALQQWASTFKSALESASTGKEIDRLRLESADQLNAEELPPVTRQFFFDLIQKRKGELPK